MDSFVANARMYSVTPEASRAWADLFDWLARKSGVDIAVVDHEFPALLPDLWARSDLACGFICGFPFSQTFMDMQPIAAPIIDCGPVAGQPRYATQFIVAADSPFTVLEHTFGGRLGYTVEDSQSGYHAVHHHLAPYRRASGKPLYVAAIGPLQTPRRVVDAVLERRIDVGPLDSYALDLMLDADPELGMRIRVVGTTRSAPIPLLAAHPNCPVEIVAALRASLVDAGADPERDGILKRLLLSGFASVAAADYMEIAPAENRSFTA